MTTSLPAPRRMGAPAYARSRQRCQSAGALSPAATTLDGVWLRSFLWGELAVERCRHGTGERVMKVWPAPLGDCVGERSKPCGLCAPTPPRLDDFDVSWSLRANFW